MATRNKIPSGIDLHGNQWRVRITRGDIKVREVFGTFEDAVRFRERTIADINGLKYLDLREERTTTLHALLQRYLDDRVPGTAGEKNKRNLIRAWQREKWALLPIVSIQSSHITAWRDKRVREDLRAPSTVSNAMNLLSKVFRIAKTEWSLDVENPVKGMARPEKRPGRVAIPDTDLESLLVSTALDGKARWLAYVVQVASWTAMRQSEITALRWSDVDFKNHVIQVRSIEQRARKGQVRYVPMLQGVEDVLRAWIGNKDPNNDGWVFPSPTDAKVRMPQDTIVCGFRDLVKKVVKNAADEGITIKTITFHDLRHWGCTRLAPLHHDALDLSKTTGHKTLSVLAIYFNPDPVERTAAIRAKDVELRRLKQQKAEAAV